MFATNAYRAATQDVTVDEAYSYLYFASLPFWKMWQVYNPNHHVLNTILSHFTTKLLPLSEFSLRLPALLGGGLYIWAAYRLSRIFERALLLVGAFALLTLNPFILDHLSVGRGYGLASAGWLWAMCWTAEIVMRDDLRVSKFELARMGTVLGLSIAANLTYAFIVTGTIAALLIVCGLRNSAWVAGTALAVIAILVAPPVLANREGFTYGVPSIFDTVTSLSCLSVFHKTASFNILDIPISPDRGMRLATNISLIIVVLTLCISAAFVANILLKIRRRTLSAVPGNQRFFLVSAIPLLVAIAGVILSHLLFHLPYPAGRTGLYLIVGFSLLVPTLVSAIPAQSRAADLTYLAFLVIAGACAVRYAVEFSTGSYAEWRFDSSSKAVFLRLRDEARSLRRPARVACTVRLAAPLEFYRRASNATWIEPVAVYPETALVQLIQYGAFDYTVFVPQDEYPRSRVRAAIVWRDSVTGAELGVPDATTPVAAGLVVGAENRPTRRDPVDCTDDSDSEIRFKGLWWRNLDFSEPLNHTITYTNQPGASFEFPFTGRGVIYYYTRAANRGRAEIQIDGKDRGVLDQYAPITSWRAGTKIDADAGGSHILTVRVLGEKDPQSQDSFVDVDCLGFEP